MKTLDDIRFMFEVAKNKTGACVLTLGEWAVIEQALPKCDGKLQHVWAVTKEEQGKDESILHLHEACSVCGMKKMSTLFL